MKSFSQSNQGNTSSSHSGPTFATINLKICSFLEAEGYEETARFTQKQLVKAVDITSATKHFELNLEFGPYRYFIQILKMERDFKC